MRTAIILREEIIMDRAGEHQRKVCGIYKITNNITNEVYIGQSVNIKRRWQEHLLHGRKQDCKNSELYNAMRTYGIENFSFEIIEECRKEKLNEREKYYIAYYDSYNNGYNMQIGNNYSRIVTDEQIKKLIFLLQNTCLSQTEIAEQLDISRTYVSRFNKGLIRNQSYLSYPLRKATMLQKRDNKKNKEQETLKKFKNVNKTKIQKVEIKRQKNYCIDCGVEIFKDSKRCNECERKRRIKESPIETYVSREKLKELIRTIPFTTIGKQFGVTDNAIRKWCKHYNLPKTKKDIKSYSDEEWNLI